MTDHTFDCMGTSVRLLVADEETAADCRAFLADFEAALSRFRPDSELSRLNAAPGARGRGLAAAAHGDLRGPAGGGAHRRARRPDADPGAGGRRLRPHAARTRAPARRGAEQRRPRARRAPPNPLEPWRQVDDRRAHDHAPARPAARHRRHGQGPRRGPARAPPPRPLGGRLRRRHPGLRRLRRPRPPSAHARDRARLQRRGRRRRHLGHRHPAVARARRHAAPPPARPEHAQPAWTGLICATALAPTAVEAEALAKAALLSGPTAPRRWLRRHGGLIVHDDGRREVLDRGPWCAWRWRHEPAGAHASG